MLFQYAQQEQLLRQQTRAVGVLVREKLFPKVRFPKISQGRTRKITTVFVYIRHLSRCLFDTKLKTYLKVTHVHITKMDKRTHAYIYQMSWFESPRHRRSYTDTYYAEPQHTLWGFDDPLCRISYIKVPINSVYFSAALNNSQKAEEEGEQGYCDHTERCSGDLPGLPFR